MCGRYTLTSGLAILQRRFGFSAEQMKLEPRYNLAPGQDAPLVTCEEKKTLRLMRWGLVPSWAKQASSGYKMINARAETLPQKASFRKPFRERRCLVLADGFYEWRKGEGKGKKTPIRFVLPSREPFAFAGLWDIWKKTDGTLVYSFTIITTQANDLPRPVHDRMPVILRPEDEDLWLDPNLKDVTRLTPLLTPYAANALEAYDVSTIVNSPKNDVPECIQPAKVSKMDQTQSGNSWEAPDKNSLPEES